VSEHDLEQSLARERDSQQRIAELERLLADAERRAARTGDLEIELRDLSLALEEMRGLVERADRVREGMQSSLSWRVTKPLRAGKGALGR
jgi:hypothetical protein